MAVLGGGKGEVFMLRKPQACRLSRIKVATNQQNTRKIAYSWFHGIALWKCCVKMSG
jgi:hypothetical protein